VCMFIVLGFALWKLINFRWLCSDDCLSWPHEKINHHGCWGTHAHIPDNDYWGICLFHAVWTIFFFLQLFLCGTHGIYFYFNLPERVQILGHAHIICPGVQNYLLSNIVRFALKICFWADCLMLHLVKIKWHIKWKYLIQKFHDIFLSYHFKLQQLYYFIFH
jgi:hypothetical protein